MGISAAHNSMQSAISGTSSTAGQPDDAPLRAAEQTIEQLHKEVAGLRDEAARMFMVIHAVAEGIISFDGEGIIDMVNPAAEKILGYEDFELVGKCVDQLLTEDPSGTASEGLKELLTCSKRNAARVHTLFGRRKDGSIVEIELAANRVQHGRNTMFTWILRDITERRNRERQFQFAQRLQSVGQLAAGIAHEINTPIQYVSDNADFLAESMANIERLIASHDKLFGLCRASHQHEAECQEIERIRGEIDFEFLQQEIPAAITQSKQGADRVGSIVKAMKDFASPPTAEKTAEDINQGIRSTTEVSSNQWRYVADMKLQLDEDLPPLRCYPAELNQVLLNLIINATQAIEDKFGTDKKGAITITTRGLGDQVEIIVHDNGIGIDESIRDRVFEPFFTTREVGHGTGQGLSIAYAVVTEKHGGQIDIQSSKDGTSVVIHLPLDSPCNRKDEQ